MKSDALRNSLVRGLRAAFAALVRTQRVAAAGTALYRNQQIEPLPQRSREPPRAKRQRSERCYALPVVPFCPLLPVRGLR